MIIKFGVILSCIFFYKTGQSLALKKLKINKAKKLYDFGMFITNRLNNIAKSLILVCLSWKESLTLQKIARAEIGKVKLKKKN